MFCLIAPIVGSCLATLFFVHSWVPLMISICVCMLLAILSCAAVDSVYSQPAKGISGAAAGTNACFNMVSSCVGTVISAAIVHIADYHVPILGVWLTVPMLAL